MSWAEMPRSPGHAFYDKLQGADSVDHQARRHHVALQQTRKAERHDCLLRIRRSFVHSNDGIEVPLGSHDMHHYERPFFPSCPGVPGPFDGFPFGHGHGHGHGHGRWRGPGTATRHGGHGAESGRKGRRQHSPPGR